MSTRWRKSSFSGGTENSNCVEVAIAETVGVRDSKNTEPVLRFSPARWRAFTARQAPRP